jgi:hypothetical protein
VVTEAGAALLMRYAVAPSGGELMTRIVLSLVVAGLTLSAGVATQQLPPPFPRKNATLLFDSGRIAVWDIVWPRGEPTVLHRHVYDQVGTYYARGGRVITTPDGNARTTMTDIGSLSTTRKGTTHIEEGNTDPPLRAVFIELKQERPSGVPLTDKGRDPRFPREGARQQLDDERVQVVDYTWTSGPNGLQYRPARETVLVWLGDGMLRVSPRLGDPLDEAVTPGTMRHFDANAAVDLEITSGSPRTIFFELK